MGTEKIPLPQSNRSLKFQDKLKVEHYVSEKYVDSNHASKLNVNKRFLIQPKPSDTRQKQWVKSKATVNKEETKCIKNVPIQSPLNVKEKALNLRLLDWASVEKLKLDQKPCCTSSNNIDSPSTSSSSSLFTVSTSNQALNENEEISPVDKSSNKNGKDEDLDGIISRKMETLSLNSRNCEFFASPNEKMNNFQEGFSPEMVPHFAEESYSEMPHSCPLLSTGPDINMKTNYSQYKDFTLDSFDSFPHLKKIPAVTPPKGNHPTRKKSNSSVVDGIINDLSEKLVKTPSPNRRFSFAINRTSRSFKEGSSAPQLSSVKSDAVSSGTSIRARSSPLRRLLDPLMKLKSPTQDRILGSTQPLKSFENELVEKEKHKSIMVQALLQCTVKNGLPLFKFVVENSSNILAATVTKSDSCPKDDLSQSFTLFNVNQVKKKNGGWINQGSKKEKNGGYVYNIAGEMKISTWYAYDLKEEIITLRESVLFGVDVPPPNRELAAIVVETLNKKSHCCDFERRVSDEEDKESLKDEESTCSSTVILPGGIHGLPMRGGPSPLLDRWRSGGSCDCGGWDLGCKICLLSSTTSDDCCESGSHELFVQGGGEGEKKAYFRLTPFKKNIYSVEFKASISLLQALFICVALKSSHQFHHLSP